MVCLLLDLYKLVLIKEIQEREGELNRFFEIHLHNIIE
jgi:hypothetical protein